MQDNTFDFSKSMGMPIDDFISSFIELKNKGFIVTPAKTSSDFLTKKYPYRLIYQAPAGLEEKSEVSLGPFALKREEYERLKNTISDRDTFAVYLGFRRLIYEKTGGTVDGYHFEAQDETLANFLGMIELWDIDNPEVFEDWVWIYPKDECRKYAEEILGKQFKENDFSWWNIRIDLGEDIKPTTIDDYPDQYGLIPSILIDSWGRYLPSLAWYSIFYLYSSVTKGGEFREFKSLAELNNLVRKGIELGNRPTGNNIIDKELLIKELCEFNAFTYPHDVTSTIEFLQQIGFIIVKQTKGKILYSMIEEIPLPEEVIKIPDGWENRMDKYISSGSILFSYLNLDEIIDD